MCKYCDGYRDDSFERKKKERGECRHPHCTNPRLPHGDTCLVNYCTGAGIYPDKLCGWHTRFKCVCCDNVKVGVSLYCHNHKCSNCSKARAYKSEFCQDHTCTVQGCYKTSLDVGKNCLAHSCLYPDCENPMLGQSEYCKQHKCMRCSEMAVDTGLCETHLTLCRSCDQKMTEGTKYCAAHQCHMNGCREGHKCSVHICLRCKQPKDSPGKFCPKCKCPTINCLYPRCGKRPGGLCSHCWNHP
jgi:hypothetical protein